jgi:adenine-specific DNA-methyltransferase
VLRGHAENDTAGIHRSLPPDQTDADDSFVFRPIHYLGSKLRVLSAVRQAVDRLDPTGGPVCDLFSGSATVSRYLSQRRRVLAVDIQEYSRVLAEAVLNGSKDIRGPAVTSAVATSDMRSDLRWAVDPLVAYEAAAAERAQTGEIGPLCELLQLGNLESLGSIDSTPASPLVDAARESLARVQGLGLPGPDTVCVRHFGGQYFSFAQAAQLDAIATHSRASENPVLLSATLSTASHLVNSIGKQFAQPIRPTDKSGAPKHHVVKKVLAERGLDAGTVFLGYLRQYGSLPMNRRDHSAVRADYREALAEPKFIPSVVYADPPYTRDHYSRFYHSLETIALGDDPSITKSNLGGGELHSRGSYRAGRHQSPFCIKSQAPGAFSDLVGGVAELGVPLVLSYSGYDPSAGARPRVMALDSVVALAKQHFRDVSVERLASVEHMKLNTVSLNKAARGTTEVLVLCR